jgi:N-formylglutamate amidohydrolase
MNRALYLDEVSVEKRSGFATLANNLETLTRRLAEAAHNS